MGGRARAHQVQQRGQRCKLRVGEPAVGARLEVAFDLAGLAGFKTAEGVAAEQLAGVVAAGHGRTPISSRARRRFCIA